MSTVSKVNDVLCIAISKIDNVLKSNAKFFDDNTFCPQTTPTPTPTPTITPTSTPPSVTPTPTPTQFASKCSQGHIPKQTVYSYYSCCYPYGQISGTSGSDTAGYDICYFPYSASTGVTRIYVDCETSGLTSCCEILLGYDINEQLNACSATQATYYISNPCLTNSCRLNEAHAIYTDDSCTTLADDGVYSDGTDYGTQSGGVFTYGGLC